MSVAHEVVEATARTAYGKLLAALVAREAGLWAAEDALAEAFQSALAQWPKEGIPKYPEGWLLAVARRRMVDDRRKAAVRDRYASEVALISDAVTHSGSGLPDQRLGLMYLCAHPAIDPAVRTPLMLQTVVGLDATRIASAFLVSPSAMAQRLVRAKKKIERAAIPFEIDAPRADERLPSVLQAVYAAYSTGWDEAFGPNGHLHGLASEAIWLARVVTRLVPDGPEPLGLLALMLHCEARRPARRDGDRYVPFDQQDVARWNRNLIDEAESALARAGGMQRPGRFQLEAAIQSCHVARRFGGADWAAVADLYHRLVEVAPTVGARVGRAAAVGEVHGASQGLASLDSLDPPPVDYQPYWAVRAHLLEQAGDRVAASEAWRRAAGMAEDSAARSHLIARAQLVPPETDE